MGCLQSNIQNNQSESTNVQEKTGFEDEMNLMDYFTILWKWKYLILVGSVLPTLLFGLNLFFSPRRYKVTYVYDIEAGNSYDLSGLNLDEKNYRILLDKFYSAENLSKVADRLRQRGLNRYAALVKGGKAREELKQFVDFEVSPPHIDLSKVRAKVIDPTKLEQIRQMRAQLLNMTIVGRPIGDIYKIASEIRDNLENTMPVYFVQQHLNGVTTNYRTEMADIEEGRFNLELALKTQKAVLAKLKDIKGGTGEKNEGSVMLQFDVGDRSEYLPLEYQIQAAESKIVQLEGMVIKNEGKYEYYKDLLALNKKLIDELKSNTSSYYTIQQFRLFLTDLVDSCPKKELKDYLNSYIKKIENRISVGAPVTDEPKICAVGKGTARKTATVFAVLLMITIIAAFLLEGIRKARAQAS